MTQYIITVEPWPEAEGPDTGQWQGDVAIDGEVEFEFTVGHGSVLDHFECGVEFLSRNLKD